MICIELFGSPVPQSRPRFSKTAGYVHTYDPLKKIKEAYQWQIRSQYRENPLNGPLLVEISFFLPVPKSTSGIRRNQMLNGILHHITKPDIDNLAKFSLDCLNKLVFHDDSQVQELRLKKLYASVPCTTIRIHPLGVLCESHAKN